MSRKLSNKQMNMKGFEQLKIDYHHFMVKYFVHEKRPLDAAKSCQVILNTYIENDQLDSTQGKALKRTAFENFGFFLLVSVFGEERQELLKNVTEKYARELDQNDLVKYYVTRFLGAELIPLDEAKIAVDCSKYEPFASMENASLHLQDLIKQIIQHNIRILERYYSLIQLPRLS